MKQQIKSAEKGNWQAAELVLQANELMNENWTLTSFRRDIQTFTAHFKLCWENLPLAVH